MAICEDQLERAEAQDEVRGEFRGGRCRFRGQSAGCDHLDWVRGWPCRRCPGPRRGFNLQSCASDAWRTSESIRSYGDVFGSLLYYQLMPHQLS